MRRMILARTLFMSAIVFAAAGTASARDVNLIHVGGECSTQWGFSGNGSNASASGCPNGGNVCFHPTTPTQFYNSLYASWADDGNMQSGDYGTKPVGRLTFPGETVHVLDAKIDNTVDIWTSVSQLATFLDTNCPNATVPGAVISGTTTVNTTCKSVKPVIPYNGKLYCAAWNTKQVPWTIDNTKDCVIFNYSGGDNVVRKMLSMYDDRWNIRAVFTIAGAGGGSEVASLFSPSWVGDTSSPNCNPSVTSCTSLPGDVLVDTLRWPDLAGARCGFQDWMDVDTVRGGYGAGWWAYDDTNGRPIYHVFNAVGTADTAGGINTAWQFSSILPGDDDGAVAYHSSLGRADVGEFYFDTATYFSPNGYVDFLTNNGGAVLASSGPNGNYYGHYYGAVASMEPWSVSHWSMKLYGMNAVAFIGPPCMWQVPEMNTCNSTDVNGNPTGWDVNEYCFAGCNQGNLVEPL